MKARRHPALVAALGPLAALYRLAIARRNARFDRGIGIERAPIPVLSIGNLEAGGTGKTPMAAWLAARLLSRGRNPAIVTRGYGGRAGRGPLDVGRGNGPLVGADLAGDEPVLLAASTGAIVVAGADRVRGAARARELGADVVILEDGFQHRRLARDLDIVLLDAATPFGNGRLLPAGPLREPPSALVRAGLIVLTRWEEGTGREGRRAVARVNSVAPIVRAVPVRLGFRNREGLQVAPPRRAVAFCGIARPERFAADLSAEGVDLVDFFPFPDHHRFSERDLERIAERALSSGAEIVTTAKDLARLGERVPEWPALTLNVALDLLDPSPLDAALDRVLGTR